MVWGVDRYPSDVLARAGGTADATKASTPRGDRDGVGGANLRFRGCGRPLGEQPGGAGGPQGKQRSFPFGRPWIDGSPVNLLPPRRRVTDAERANTTTGRTPRLPVGPSERAGCVAQPSCRGRHDAELVEKVWGADLRHVGVVVEFLGRIDDLPSVVGSSPRARAAVGRPGRPPGAGHEGHRIAAQVSGSVLITGHEVHRHLGGGETRRLGIASWPQIPAGRTGSAGCAPRWAGRTGSSGHRLGLATDPGQVRGWRTSTATSSPR